MSESNLKKDYLTLTEWLFKQFPSYQVIGAKAYKPTLDNTFALVESIGNPERELTFIHVAGSNGKGSVCSMLSSILTESGYKVGLFTSPHIKDYRERIRINGECIDEQSVVDFIKRIKQKKYGFEPSFFEVTFAMALDYFKQQECDICVIETGLGGRLDSTNIISPIVSVITSISLEHTNILGETLTEIAKEKAGIIKENAAVVIGNLPDEVMPVFLDLKRDQTFYNTKGLTTKYSSPLIGKHQLDNLVTVEYTVKVLNEKGYSITEEAFSNGLNHLSNNTGFACRLQIMERDPYLIFDVSHNPEGIQASIKAVEELSAKNYHIIYGTSNDKDVTSILRYFPSYSHYYFCEFNSERSMQLSDLKTLVKERGLKKTSYFSSGEKALKAAKTAAEQDDLILVIGSFFLISDFL